MFTFNERSTERLRQVRMVLEGSNSLHLGEIEGALCLRLNGNKRKTQVTALVSQDEKKVRRLTLQTFQTRASGWSTHAGPKAIIDASDRGIVAQIRAMGEGQRTAVIQALSGSLTGEEINVLLGRRQGLEEFEVHMTAGDWSESDWQQFFDRQQWVFGYGLDYRVMRHFDRELVVGGAGTDNQNKPTVDFLATFTDYTVLVEIKRPDTRIFRAGKGGRAGTWEFSPEFTSAVSQVIEQKAEWLAFAQGEHWNKAGTRKLEARTRSPKTILVIGSRDEFDAAGNSRSAQIMRDTFELFRRDSRIIDILTFDELLERARFITRSE